MFGIDISVDTHFLLYFVGETFRDEKCDSNDCYDFNQNNFKLFHLSTMAVLPVETIGDFTDEIDAIFVVIVSRALTIGTIWFDVHYDRHFFSPVFILAKRNNSGQYRSEFTLRSLR